MSEIKHRGHGRGVIKPKIKLVPEAKEEKHVKAVNVKTEIKKKKPKLTKEEKAKKELEDNRLSLNKIQVEYEKNIKPLGLKQVNEYMQSEIDGLTMVVGTDEQKQTIQMNEYQILEKELQTTIIEMADEIPKLPAGDIRELVEQELADLKEQLKNLQNDPHVKNA